MKSEGNTVNLGAFFLTLEYVAMAAIFIALVLIFMYAYYGREEETVE